MAYLRFSIVLLVLLSAGAFAREGFLKNINIPHGTKMYTFRCDSGTVSPSEYVTLKDATADINVLKQQLKEIDDCNQASWLTEKIGKDALLNPGRMGLNAQYNALLVADESVSPAGYLPVSAEKVGDFEYRSCTSETGSVWERTDTLQEGKFRVTKELQLILSGSICTNKARKVINQDPCKDTLIAPTSKNRELHDAKVSFS
jgi:hypothetical protein